MALYLILMLVSFALEAVLKTIFHRESYFVVFFVTVLIATYECISVCENILAINPNLTFLKDIISVSERMQSQAIKIAEDKIDNLTVKVEPKVEVKTVDEINQQNNSVNYVSKTSYVTLILLLI